MPQRDGPSASAPASSSRSCPRTSGRSPPRLVRRLRVGSVDLADRDIATRDRVPDTLLRPDGVLAKPALGEAADERLARPREVLHGPVSETVPALGHVRRLSALADDRDRMLAGLGKNLPARPVQLLCGPDAVGEQSAQVVLRKIRRARVRTVERTSRPRPVAWSSTHLSRWRRSSRASRRRSDMRSASAVRQSAPRGLAAVGVRCEPGARCHPAGREPRGAPPTTRAPTGPSGSAAG